MLRGDLAADHAFAWSAGRPLAWRDFQGSPPSEGSEGAKTSYTLYSGWKCRGDVFEFRVIAGFRPRQSWVKAIVLNDSMQRRTILRHEQTHFDLAEVHARRMRRAFADLARPCAKTDAELRALVQRLAQEEKAEQRHSSIHRYANAAPPLGGAGPAVPVRADCRRAWAYCVRHRRRRWRWRSTLEVDRIVSVP
ncbi:MAG: hypothetical protein DMD59_12700 [Gemmatimonadetes bacterium]|nr:MAG: hypothetical protein DMD59_12700 [Gemmatimonadota bacterium]